LRRTHRLQPVCRPADAAAAPPGLRCRRAASGRPHPCPADRRTDTRRTDRRPLMNPSRLMLAALGAAALAACTQQPSMPREEVVATIDGRPLSRNTFEQYVAGVTGMPLEEVPEAGREE